MRSLASGRHSAADVAQRLAEDHTIGVEFFVADRNGSIVDQLDVLLEPDPTINVNTGQQVKTTLQCVTRPHPLLREAPLKWRIKVFGTIGMRDGSGARFTLGTYVPVWPRRSIRLMVGGVDERWRLMVGCRTHLLNITAPGRFVAEAGERATDTVNRLLRIAGVRERVATHPATLSKTYTWSYTKPRVVTRWEGLAQAYESKARSTTLARPKRVAALRRLRSIRRWLSTQVVNTAEVTFLSIINEVADAAGFHPLWFDWDDRPRFEPAPDLGRAKPTIDYRTVASGLVTSEGYETESDVARRANEVIVVPSGHDLHVERASLDDLMPAHPFAPRRCGYRIPKVVPDSVALTQAAVKARARKECFARAGLVEQIRWESLWHPGHEHFEVCAVQMPGDAELGVLTPVRSEQFQVNCVDLGVAHEATRTWPG